MLYNSLLVNVYQYCTLQSSSLSTPDHLWSLWRCHTPVHPICDWLQTDSLAFESGKDNPVDVTYSDDDKLGPSLDTD